MGCFKFKEFLIFYHNKVELLYEQIMQFGFSKVLLQRDTLVNFFTGPELSSSVFAVI